MPISSHRRIHRISYLSSHHSSIAITAAAPSQQQRDHSSSAISAIAAAIAAEPRTQQQPPQQPTIPATAAIMIDHKTTSHEPALLQYGYVPTSHSSWFSRPVLPAKQLRQLQLGNPRIADKYRQQLHRLFTGHNVYRRVKIIMERSKTGDWSIEDESGYEKIDRDITRPMLSAAKKCGNRSRKRKPWSPELGMATQSIWYWYVRIKRKGERNSRDLVLNFYLSKSDVDRDAHDKPLSIKECIKQLNFSRQKLKDVVANAKE
jgi:hypothetical protein